MADATTDATVDPTTAEVLVEEAGALARLRLNRPKAIHALTRGMCVTMGDALARWREDDRIRLVTIDHAPAPDGDPKLSRGFCAGGDVRAIWESGRGDGAAARAFFFDEYRLNHQLFTYAKPTVAFMDGLTLGGGVGISQPCRYRIATERTGLAMPETGIGLFPDVGGGWYLSRLPGRIGEYLALTGARVGPGDCVALGLATHYVPSDELPALKARLAEAPREVAVILDAADRPAPPPALDAIRADVDRLFAADTLEDVLAALAADGGAWAAEQHRLLLTKSPQACAVSLALLAQGRDHTDFADEMRVEYRLATRVCQRNDFLEGVRALLVDRTNDPRWDPPAAPVPPTIVDRIFAPLDPADEWTPRP